MQNGITVTNDKASSTVDVADYSNPARFYAGSNLTISYPNMTKMVIDCSGLDAKYVDSWLNVPTNATATKNNNIITIVFDSPVDSITYTGLVKQSRAYSITVYAEVEVQPEETTPEETTPEVTTPEVTTPEETTPEVTTPEEITPEEPEKCKHTNTTVEGATEATCATVGNTGSTVCADCGKVLAEGKEITKTEHAMADWVQIRAAACTTEGLERSDCDNCTYYETKTSVALGHKDADNDEICDTCNEEIVSIPEQPEDSDGEKHVCKEVTPFQAFINAIINFFRRLMGQPELCSCGETFIKKEQ